MGIMFFGKTRFKDLASSLEKVKKKKKTITATIALLLAFSFPAVAQEHYADDGHGHTPSPSKDQVDSLITSPSSLYVNETV